MINEKNIALFERHRVFSQSELLSRYEIGLENYCKLCNIEAVTIYKITKRNILPAGAIYAGELSSAATAKSTFLPETECVYERDTVRRLTEISDALHKKETELFDLLCAAEDIKDLLKKAIHYKELILTKMGEIRELIDEMELLVSRKHWPFPTYGDLLFSVR